jgi:DNA-directed RNA polymerase alpha subunit
MNKDITTDEYFTKICPNTRIRNALMRSNINTMAQVCAMSEERLMRIRNFGMKCLDIVLEERQKYIAESRLPPPAGTAYGNGARS